MKEANINLMHLPLLEATAGTDHHVLVLLKHNVATVIVIEYGDWTEFGRCTAGLRYRTRAHVVDECLHDSVIGSIGVPIEREGALALAVESHVPKGCDDPFLFLKKEGEGVELNVTFEYSNLRGYNENEGSCRRPTAQEIDSSRDDITFGLRNLQKS